MEGKMKLKTILRGAFLLVCLLIVGCGGDKPKKTSPEPEPKPAKSESQFSQWPQGSPTKSYKIGILYWSLNIEGQVAMKAGLEKEFDRINQKRKEDNLPLLEKELVVAGDGIKGIENQIKQMEAMIDGDYDLIIVQPTDISALSRSLQRANKKGLPVIAYDQHILNGELKSYITSDNFQAGYLCGEYVASNFENDKELKIVLVEYSKISGPAMRVNGFIDGLESNSQKYKVLKSYTAVEPVSGKKAGLDILKDFPGKGSVDVIFTINDGGGLAVVQELENAGRDDIFLATVDGAPDSVAKIKNEDSIIKIDSAQFCSEMGVQTMRVAYQYLCGRRIAKQYLVPVFPITKETVEKYNGWYGEVPENFKKPWQSKKPLWENKVY
jgi:ribose transport system substrate-binding protein